MTDAALGDLDVLLAVFEPADDGRAVDALGRVLAVHDGDGLGEHARADAAAECRGGQDVAAALVDAAAGVVVNDAAVGGGTGVEISDGLVDRFLGDLDAGVPRRPQPLQRRHRHRTLIEVRAILGTHVAPAADVHALAFGERVLLARLRLGDEIDRAGEDRLELLALLLVFFLAVHTGQEQGAISLSVHVARAFGRVVEVADLALG